MADQPIIKIQIDAEDFDKFADRFNAYREKLNNQPEEWKATNAEIKEMRSNFEDAGKALEKVQAGSTVTPTVERKEKERSKRVKEDEKSWKNIGKSISTSYRDLSGLAKMSVGISSGKFGLGSLGALGAIYGAVLASANGLSERNAQNRQLDVAPGVAKAYGKAYAKFGGSEGQLATFEEAKVRPQMWQPMLAVGVTQDEIKGDDAEQLAASYLRKAGQKWESLPESSRGGWFDGTHQGDLGMSVGAMNQAGSYKDDDSWNQAQSDFEKYRQQDADAQPDLDAGTAFKQHVGADWDAITKSFDHNAALLAPALEKWADAATAYTTAFLNQAGPQAAELANDINGTPPSVTPDNIYPHTVDGGFRKFGDGAWRYFDAFKNTGGIERNGTSSSPTEAAVKEWVGNNVREGGGARFRGDDTQNPADPRYNPGNLRVPGSKTEFQTFDSEAAGVRGMDRQIQIYAGRDHLDTLQAIIAKYAPSSENNTQAYVSDVSARTGYKADQRLDMYDPRVRASVESAMIQHEGRDYRDLTADKVLAITRGKADDDGDNAGDGGRVSTGSVTAGPSAKTRKQVAATPAAADVRQADNAPTAGSMPPILTRPAGMGALPAQQINVAVSAPPGSSVSVTTAGFPM